MLQEVEYVKTEDKLMRLEECLQKTAPPVMVFAEKTRDVDMVHEALLLRNINAAAIHGAPPLGSPAGRWGALLGSPDSLPGMRCRSCGPAAACLRSSSCRSNCDRELILVSWLHCADSITEAEQWPITAAGVPDSLA